MQCCPRAVHLLGRAQRQHGADCNTDPADTGAAFGVPIVFEGDRLAVKVIPGGPAVAGTLHVWLI